MSLEQWSTALRRAWPVVAIMTALGVAAAGLYLARATPQYTAQTTVFFSFARGGTASELNQGTTFAQGLVKSFAEIVTTEQVLQPVIDRLDLDLTTATLARRVEAAQSEDTLLLKLQVTDRAPATAARTADAIADQLRRSVADLVPSSPGAAETIEVTRLARAEVPTSPSSPRSAPVVLGVGTLLGLCAGLGLVTLMALFDDRVRTAAALRQATGTRVLGELTPRADEEVLDDGRPNAVEPVRRLRTHLATVLERERVNTVLLTSVGRGDGRTSTAVALAESFAEAGRRVVLVEADLRHPSLAHRLAPWLPVTSRPGLSEVVNGTAPLAAALQAGHVEGLSVLVAGAAVPDPGRLLASPTLSQLLRQLSGSFDIVIADGPDLTTTADAITLGRQMPATVLLARQGRTRGPQLQRVSEALALAEIPVLGAVLNRVGRVRRGSYLRLNSTPPPVISADDRGQDAEWLLDGPDDGSTEPTSLSTRR